MSYRLPPLNGLRAFEAAGRHLSFRRAAEELAVTPGAVSQQIKHLEQALGVPLFQRLHRSLILTGHGETLLPAVSDAFHLLSTASDTVSRSLTTRALRLGISPRLAKDPEDLLARLGNRRRLAELVRVTPTDDFADLMDGSLDAILRPGGGSYPGMHVEALTLTAAFAPHRQAAIIVWPGLARCRGFLKVRALLTEP